MRKREPHEMDPQLCPSRRRERNAPRTQLHNRPVVLVAILGDRCSLYEALFGAAARPVRYAVVQRVVVFAGARDARSRLGSAIHHQSTIQDVPTRTLISVSNPASSHEHCSVTAGFLLC
jgi:hypothetical protein